MRRLAFTCSLRSMTRRVTALVLLLTIGLSSVEVLLPGEARAASSAGAIVADASGADTQRAARADCTCLCACGCMDAQVVVLADAVVPLGPYLTFTEVVPAPSSVVVSVEPFPQFRPPRA